MTADETRCAVEIDGNRFLKNYEEVKKCIPDNCRLMAVLKGNAYGHGAPELAVHLEKYKEDWIAVATLGEALKIRQAGVTKDILILGYTSPLFAEELSDKHITQTVISWRYGKELSRNAAKAGKKVSCHLALDTGMSRIGLLAYGAQRENSMREAGELYQDPYLEIGGIFTHFSSAYGHEPEDESYTARQYERFVSFCQELKKKGIEPGLRHCCNSPSIINYPQYALDMCRGGTLLFGFIDQKEMRRPVDLKLVMRFRTIVTMIKEVEAGTAVSYNRTAVTDKRTRLAVLGAGWYDGYPRQLGNRGRVLIRGREFPIIGKVCMDICMADITGADDICEGDEVVLLGSQGDREIPCRQLYEPLGVGPGSIGGGISERVPRIYKWDEGEEHVYRTL